MDKDLMLTDEQQRELEKQWEILSRGAVEIIPEDEFKRKIAKSIKENKPLKVKLGLDPSAPDIHIGHTVPLQKLRQFQELGHTVQLVIGDFTGQIGDPTGKSETRKQLSKEQVRENAETYVKQLFKVLDPQKTEIHYNSEWLEPLTFVDVVNLAGKITVARMLERDDFEKRFKANQSISIHEFFYPLMQGYDSVALKSDVEIGGTDQKFNLLMGRHLQKEYGVEQQSILMLPLIEGLDGVQKMSKSLGNYIGIDEEPNQIYGKAMSIPDELMIKYYQLVTDLPHEEVQRMVKGLQEQAIHPRDAKMKLAYTLVRMYHGEEAAKEAEQHFKTVFQKGALPDDIPVVELEKEQLEGGKVWIVKLIVTLGLVPSNGEGRRMVKQGAVKINGQKVDDLDYEVNIEQDMVVQVGKRKFAKIKLQ
ncbi:tyrosine--tRNA ligase [Vulcanibacillus modesticaldus]|uniref:Tyrosine--tRNA ligase n=1 Tax=Vulcanibacillus modesticaldus TaxID=337097 RepID=A0A1D2YU62_9BACI|nr:tyrosine--tRNA ligase [Vulcanibacillus modesticaldus]OEF99191.1 tyrosine--tRNA ligase [Vulcanibacillus modesticaldus]